MTVVRKLISAAMATALIAVAGHAAAADIDALNAQVQRWTAEMNAGHFKAVYAQCAPHAAVVDGFPPYAWDTCQGWMRDYVANNKRTKAANGTLTIGKPLWTDVNGSHALLTYDAVFTNVQDGKSMTYKGLWAVSLERTKLGWRVTGSGSAWKVD
jgi:hypothetical protein